MPSGSSPGPRQGRRGSCPGRPATLAFVGWHGLSDATCLTRPHWFSTALLV